MEEEEEEEGGRGGEGKGDVERAGRTRSSSSPFPQHTGQLLLSLCT